ncbi:MAG: DUF1736 domain-containing protein, partial [Candidatus Sumerlaeota bacterium]|nr:DUF1736 domain-containing protein [Candidatus Sumerlaeota bacterium]
MGRDKEHLFLDKAQTVALASQRKRAALSAADHAAADRPNVLEQVENLLRRGARRLAPVGEYVAIFLAATLVYANSLGNEFAFDDVAVVAHDLRIRHLDRPRGIFLTSYWNDLTKGMEYRPLTILSYALNYAAAKTLRGDGAGLYPRGFHLTNVLLHGLVSCLAAWMVAGLFGRRMLGAATGLLFALHPIHTETVAGVVGRAELLAAAGFFLALLAWRKARESKSLSGAGLWALGVAAAYALGVFSKENALTLAGVAILEVVIWRRVEQLAGRPTASWKSIARRIAPGLAAILAVTAAYLGARHEVLGAVTRPDVTSIAFQDNPIFSSPTPQRVATALRIQGDYLWLLAWPQRLCADYSYNAEPVSHSFLETGVLLGAMELGALCVAFLVGLWESPTIAFAIGFYALTMSLTSNLLFPIGAIKAERLL